MIDSSLVLFGGFLILLSLKRKHVKTRKRTRGFLRIFAILVETLVLSVGIGAFMIGFMKLLR
jgi:hypothetical protein